ncbi:MAG: S8 family serine peptidase [Gammaproteobacteria bacterium]
MEWADPWVPTADITGSTPDDPNDYDTVLYDASGNILACTQGSTTDSSGCSQAGAAASTSPGVEPGVGVEWTNTSGSSVTVNLAIFKRTGTPSNMLKLFVASPNSCEVLISPVTPEDSIVDHAALPYPAEISVGAMNASTVQSKTYAVAPYSSQGPVLLPLLTSTPIQKPDFIGVDGVSISGAGGFPPAECGQPAPNPPIYYGTSAAAPHVAALIALLESAGYSSDQVYGVLSKNALTLTDDNFSNGSGVPNGMFGYGIANISSVPAANGGGSGGGSGGGGSSGSGGGGGGFWFIAIMVLTICVRYKSKIKHTL